MPPNTPTYLIQLQQLIKESFNLAEIRTLCLQLNVDYESIAGEEKPSMIRELLLMLGRNGRLSELITLLQYERPNVNWPPVPDDFELPLSIASLKEAQQIINTGGGAYIGGNVNMGGGDFSGRDKVIQRDFVHGDKVIGEKVQRDKVSDTEDIGTTNVALGVKHQQLATAENESSLLVIATAFAMIQTAIDQTDMNDAQKVVVQTAVDSLRTEAEKGEAADTRVVEQWLEMLMQIAPDIAEFAINTFIHPIKNISSLFGKVAQKLRAKGQK